MPYKCCVPACAGNYTVKEKVHIFSFPKDEKLRSAWIRAIPRKDFVCTHNSRVCEKHFMAEDIVRETSMFDEKTGVTISASLKNPRLRDGAVPTRFPGCPSYLSKLKTSSSSPDKKRAKREQEDIANAIKDFPRRI